MKVGLEEYRHEAGECYERQVATLDGPCGDPRCEKANAKEGTGLTVKHELRVEWSEAQESIYVLCSCGDEVVLGAAPLLDAIIQAARAHLDAQ